MRCYTYYIVCHGHRGKGRGGLPTVMESGGENEMVRLLYSVPWASRERQRWFTNGDIKW